MERESLSGGIEPLGADLVIPSLALAFAAYFFVSIDDLGWEAKANGVIIGWTLVALIAAQILRVGVRVARGSADLGFHRLFLPRDAFWKRLGLVAITVVFVVTLKWLGVTLGLFLGLLASLYLLGIRKPRVLIAVPGVSAAAVYVLFIAILDSAFPHGPIEILIAALLR